MSQILEPADRLVVAADFKPEQVSGVAGVRGKVLALASKLEGTGVYIKINSILRSCGYGLIGELHDLGVRVMADLKLNDIPNTMKLDAALLEPYRPDLLTIMASSGVDGMAAVCAEMGADTEVLAVTILTTFDEECCHEVYNCPTKVGVLKLARLASAAECDGLVLSGKEVPIIAKRPEIIEILTLNTPGVRPEWSVVEGDDQKRIVTPSDAIKSGVDRIIIGRPITQADDPREAVQKTLEEISTALESEENDDEE